MFENDLYTILKWETSDGTSPVVAEIALDEQHPLFGGHFPGNPILPGVCTVQIICELLSKAEERPLQLSRAANIKYLGFIVPSAMAVVVFTLQRIRKETGEIGCNVTVTSNGGNVCSFKGDFIPFPESASHRMQEAGLPG